MLTKGMTSTIPWLEKHRREERPARDGGGDVRRSRATPRACSRSSARSRPPARAAASCGRRSAASRSAWSSRCATRIRSRRSSRGARPSWPRRGSSIAPLSPMPSFRAALKDEIGRARRAQSLQRQELGSPHDRRGDARRAPRARGQDHRRSSRASCAGIRGTCSSTSASTASSTRCSTAACSTSTRTRCRSCCATRTPRSPCPTPARTSRSSATPASACTCFGHWVRERGDLTLEQAVRSVTSAVAGAYRIPDRGALVPGRVGRSHAVRPEDGGARPEAPRQRSADRREPARHAGGRPPRGVGQRRAHAGRGRRHPRRGRPGRLLREFGA